MSFLNKVQKTEFVKKHLHKVTEYDRIIFGCETNAGVSEWQTRQTQNLLWATTYGFKSHCRQCKTLEVSGVYFFALHSLV